MNITRQYKLYRLGVTIPQREREIISFVENIFERLTLAKNEEYPDVDFYVDVTTKRVYMENYKNVDMLCRYGDFWGILDNKYNLDYEEIEKLLIAMLMQYFKLDVIRLDTCGSRTLTAVIKPFVLVS